MTGPQFSNLRHRRCCASNYWPNSTTLPQLMTLQSGTPCFGHLDSLTATDARMIEDAFRARLKSSEKLPTRKLSMRRHRLSIQSQATSVLAEPGERSATNNVDKSRLAHPEPRRFRDKDHVKFVANEPVSFGETTFGWASSSLCPAPRTWPQGER